MVETQIKTQVVLEMTSPEGILRRVAEGVGLTILSELYVRLRLADRGCGLSACTILFHDSPPRPSKAQSPQHCDDWIRTRN